MQRLTASATWSIAAVALIAGAASLSGHVTPSVPASPVAVAATTATGPVAAAVQKTANAAAAVARTTAAATTTAAAAVAAVAAASPAVPPAIRIAANSANTAISLSDGELRTRIKWVPVRWGGEKTKTLDEESRLLLAQAAADRADLDKVGLSFQDVYGVIDAETSWVPRKGMGRNGVSSHGLAQFEARTARGLGLKDPNDPVQAVNAAALNMKHGAEWAADRIRHLKLSPEEYQAKIREGVSIYYNLSIRGRNKWDGLNTAQLPIETQRHIRNVRAGAEKAADLAEDILS